MPVGLQPAEGIGFIPAGALAAFAKELAEAGQPPADLHREICACVGLLARTLKPEYAQEVLQAVDVEDTPVKAFGLA